MAKTVCAIVLALVALSFVEGQGIGNPETRPAQQSASSLDGTGGTGGAGGLVVPMSEPSGQPTTASQPAQLPQTQQQPYDIFDWLFNDYGYNTNPVANDAASNNRIVNNNMNNNNNAFMNNDMLMAMMMGFDLGF